MDTAFLAATPKAELHLHFQGSIRPETLLDLARRHRISLPAHDVEGLRHWFRFRDFAHFVEVYAVLRACLVEAADYELVTHELGAELARQNVRYAEVIFHWPTSSPPWPSTDGGMALSRSG
jgi:adenosine deaminase